MSEEDPTIERTRQALWDIPPTPDDRVHMKNPAAHRYGSFSAIDLLKKNYPLQLKGEKGQLHFEDIDAVLAAGWRLD